MTDVQINRLLLFNPRVNIEAGTCALRQAIDQEIAWQRQGKRANMPVAPEFSYLKFDQSLYTKYDNAAARQYGPDLFSWLVSTRFPHSPTVQSIMNNLLVADLGNFGELPLLSIIVKESGVLGDPVPGVIVGATTLEKVDLIYKIAKESNCLYLKNAAIRSLKALVDDSNKQISFRAFYFLNELSLKKIDISADTLEKTSSVIEENSEADRIEMYAIEDNSFNPSFEENEYNKETYQVLPSGIYGILNSVVTRTCQ
jgi:hypothetical protein